MVCVSRRKQNTKPRKEPETMVTTKCKDFKGEIENYMVNGQNNFDSKVNKVFSCLNLKTCLCRANIIRREGCHACHLLFVFIVLPLLKIRTIASFPYPVHLQNTVLLRRKYHLYPIYISPGGCHIGIGRIYALKGRARPSSGFCS